MVWLITAVRLNNFGSDPNYKQMNQCALCSAAVKTDSDSDSPRNLRCSECITLNKKRKRTRAICKKTFRKSKRLCLASKNKSEARGVRKEQQGQGGHQNVSSLLFITQLTQKLLKKLIEVNSSLKQTQKKLKKMTILRGKVQNSQKMVIDEAIDRLRKQKGSKRE